MAPKRQVLHSRLPQGSKKKKSSSSSSSEGWVEWDPTGEDSRIPLQEFPKDFTAWVDGVVAAGQHNKDYGFIHAATSHKINIDEVLKSRKEDKNKARITYWNMAYTDEISSDDKVKALHHTLWQWVGFPKMKADKEKSSLASVCSVWDIWNTFSRKQFEFEDKKGFDDKIRRMELKLEQGRPYIFSLSSRKGYDDPLMDLNDPLREALKRLQKNFPYIGPSYGITSSTGHVGGKGSTCTCHVEDLNVYSVNVMGQGLKLWTFIHSEDRQKYVDILKELYNLNCDCMAYAKKIHVTAGFLKYYGIRYWRVLQRPGDIVVTFPGAFHEVINLERSINFSTRFILRWDAKFVGMAERCTDPECQLSAEFRETERPLRRIMNEVKRYEEFGGEPEVDELKVAEKEKMKDQEEEDEEQDDKMRFEDYNEYLKENDKLEQNAEDVKKGHIRCNFCPGGKQFGPTNIKAHWGVFHSTLKYQCPLKHWNAKKRKEDCPFTAPLRRNMMNHLRTKHEKTAEEATEIWKGIKISKQ